MISILAASFAFNSEQVKSYNQKPSNHHEEVAAIIEGGFFLNSNQVLDIGCGDGKLTACFASQLPEVHFIGCDVSPTMIEYATHHYTASNLEFIVKNAEELNLGNQFDRVISFSCLHWIKNQKKAIEQIFQVLRPGGKILLIATPNSSNNDFKAICRDIIFSLRWAFYFLTFQSTHSFHTEREYKNILTAAGFEINQMETKQAEMVFKNREELEPFLRAILTPLQHLDPAYHSAFLEDFYFGLAKLGRIDPDGLIHIFFDQIEIQAQK